MNEDERKTLIFAVAHRYHGKSLKSILHIEKNHVDIYFLFITLIKF